jgi:hypothetical protein
MCPEVIKTMPYGQKLNLKISKANQRVEGIAYEKYLKFELI